MKRNRYRYVQLGARPYQWDALRATCMKVLCITTVVALGIMCAYATVFGN